MLQTETPCKALAYICVSPEARSGQQHSIDTQQASTHDTISDRGWSFVRDCVDVGVSSMIEPQCRDALRSALDDLDSGDADVLVVDRITRITHSLLAWSVLIERGRCHGWTIVVDGIDASTAAGELALGVLAAVTQYEWRQACAHKTRPVCISEHSPPSWELVEKLLAVVEQYKDPQTKNSFRSHLSNAHST